MSHPKGYIKPLFIILLALTGFYAYRLLVPTEKKHRGNEAVETITGVVIQYGSNHIGDIDKILIGNSADKVWVHFPPHTAKKLLEIAKLNSSVTAELKKEEPVKKPARELLSLKTPFLQDKIIINEIPPPAPNPGMTINVSGPLAKLQVDEHGHVAGFTLADKLIQLSPKAAETIGSLLQQAKSIEVKGAARRSDEGFVNSSGLLLVKPITIKIDNVNYLVQ